MQKTGLVAVACGGPHHRICAHPPERDAVAGATLSNQLND